MARREKPPLAELEAKLGYAFRDADLAARALTHLSAQTAGTQGRLGCYERLEFLGDRVLGLAVAQMLYEAYPQASEGELSMRLATLVRRETCAEIAQQWDVGPHIVLGLGEGQAGGRKKIAILSDIAESLIGAVFVEAGFDAARKVVARSWRERMNATLTPERDAKTSMQEWAQARALDAPSYVEVERSGPDHAPRFTIQVSLEGYEPALGSAASKRAAEQAAAQAFMARRAAPDHRHE
ncbi:MAG: ribonuclease III [Roseiarcus sp.]